jgi:glycosyltransferase involved in cell wall biosynthesis
MTTSTAPVARSTPPKMSATPELSVVMPCLNEADTIAICIEKAKCAIAEHGIDAEIVIADNGSTDGSQEIARKLGARVVPVTERGYGAALMGGITAARGTYVMMGDADDSYDWLEIPRFLSKLREGYALVQGCRLETGGGTVKPGAMPFLHRWWGNPMFTTLARWWFRTPIHDIYCGMRAFSREMWLSLDQRCTGMEFALEMMVKASLFGTRTTEIPITLHPDGRSAHPPHLKTFRDGWRSLRFFLLFSPRWLFLMPGILLIVAGLAGYALAMPQLRIGRVTFDVHTLLFASLAIICGYQSIAFALMTKVFAIMEGLLPEDPRLNRFFKLVKLESGLVVGAVAMLVGLVLLAGAVHQWASVDFGALNYAHTMRWVIPGVMLTALGFQTILFSFFGSLLGMRRR